MKQRLAVALVLLAIALSNALWLAADNRPPDWDQSRYILMTKGFADQAREWDSALLRLVMEGNHPTHPHLVPALASVPYLLTGRSVDGAYFLNTLFLLGTALLVFFITRRWSGPWQAWAAACMVTGLPLLANFTRIFSLELGAVFFVTLAFYCLLRTRGFSAGWWTLAWGLACGAALLTKWTTVVFLLAPAGIWLASIVRPRERSLLSARARHVAAALTAAALIALPWYYTHRVALRRFLEWNEKGRLWAAGPGDRGGLWFYLDGFVGHAGWPITLLVVLGLLGCLLKPRRETLALLGWILLPLAVFSFLLATRNVRHLLPAYPALAIACGCSLSLLRPPGMRKMATALLGGAFLFLHFQLSWGFLQQGKRLSLATGLSIYPWALILPEAKLPEREPWPFDEMLQAVQDDWETRGVDRPPRVLVVSGNFPFRPSGFAYVAAEKFPEMRMLQLPLFTPPDNPTHRHPDTARLLDADYYLLRQGDINGNTHDMMRYSLAAKRFVLQDQRAGGRLFESMRSFRLPRGRSAQVYRLRRARDPAVVLDALDWVHELDPDDPSIAPYLRARLKSGALPAVPAPMEILSLLGGADRHPVSDSDVRWLLRLSAERAVPSDCAEAATRFLALGQGTAYLRSPFEHAGDCLSQINQPQRAHAAYIEAVKDLPESISAHAKLGEQEAVRTLETMKRYNPHRDTARFRVRLGELARQAGRISEARHHYDIALENVPGDPTAEARRNALPTAQER